METSKHKFKKGKIYHYDELLMVMAEIEKNFKKSKDETTDEVEMSDWEECLKDIEIIIKVKK